MSIESAVKEYIQENGISQTFLAKKCGVSRQRMNNILNGRTTMPAKDLAVICEALSVAPDYFTGPVPDIIIGGNHYHQITVTGRSGEVLAVITSDSVIEHEGYAVILT